MTHFRPFLFIGALEPLNVRATVQRKTPVVRPEGAAGRWGEAEVRCGREGERGATGLE